MRKNNNIKIAESKGPQRDKPRLIETRYWTEIELSQRWNVSVQFLRKRRDRREPPLYSKFGNRVRYHIDEIERYEATAQQSARPQSRLPTTGAR